MPELRRPRTRLRDLQRRADSDLDRRAVRRRLRGRRRLAWEKAHEYIGKIAAGFQSGSPINGFRQAGAPQNVGSQRALAFASRSELYDRALWTKTAAVTHAGGAATALVGSPETVAAAILDYVDRGASLV